MIHVLDASGRNIQSRLRQGRKVKEGEHIKDTACGLDAAWVVFESDDHVSFVGSDLVVNCPACIDVLDVEYALEYESKLTKLVKRLKRTGEYDDFDWDDFDLVRTAVIAA